VRTRIVRLVFPLLLLGACGSSSPVPGLGAGGAGGSGGGGGDTGLEGGVPDVGPLPALNPVAAHGQLQVVGTTLQDQSGQPVQLKGVSSQWLNYESAPFPESKPALQFARDAWKLSVVRAAMGVNASGGYLGTGTGTNANPTAMQAKVETIIQNAIDLGIYVIVDWHTSNAVSATTTQTTQAVAFFTAIAQKYGAYPNVIYEPYNEPSGQGVTWAVIKPYHEAVVAAIRAQDPDNLIVLGTPTFSQDVDVAALDPVAGTNLLYTLHFYACTHKQSLRDKGTLAIQRGIALFITEFGATPADGGVVSRGDPFVCEAEANSWFAWMAQNNVSGLSWKLDQGSDTSNILTADAPVDGPWTDNYLTSDANGTPIDGGVEVQGHGLFVVSWIRQWPAATQLAVEALLDCSHCTGRGGKYGACFARSRCVAALSCAVHAHGRGRGPARDYCRRHRPAGRLPHHRGQLPVRGVHGGPARAPGRQAGERGVRPG
jgi:endoglucanase